jgi:hypothetical protein
MIVGSIKSLLYKQITWTKREIIKINKPYSQRLEKCTFKDWKSKNSVYLENEFTMVAENAKI